MINITLKVLKLRWLRFTLITSKLGSGYTTNYSFNWDRGICFLFIQLWFVKRREKGGSPLYICNLEYMCLEQSINQAKKNQKSTS